MTYPLSAPKLQVACWLAFATTLIATAGGDRVHLHRLFEPSGPALSLRGSRSESQAWSFLQDLADQPAAADSQPTLAAIARLLPPASVWLIISDLYFDDREGILARALTRAQRGLSWVLLLDLDSWLCERAILGHGARRILGPGVADDEIRLEVNPHSLHGVTEAITRHKAQLLEPVPRRGLSRLHWLWPDTPQPDPAAFFEHMLTTDEHLQRLFRRQC